MAPAGDVRLALEQMFDQMAAGESGRTCDERHPAARGHQRLCCPPNAPNRFEKVPMPASVNEMLKRRSWVTFVCTNEPCRLKVWYSTPTPQHWEL